MNITKGKIQRPKRVVIYGPEGVGKTTLAASFPSPIFIDVENGSLHLEVDRFDPPESWMKVKQCVQYVCKSEYKTLVIDTADRIERLIFEHVCSKSNKESIEDFGWQKGFTFAADELSKFLGGLDDLIASGVNVVFLAHSTIRKFDQPDALGSYDRYELKLSKQCAPLLKEWCDMLLFCNYQTKVRMQDGKVKASGGKERLIFTTHSSAYDAKNRDGFEDVLPMNFASISSAILGTKAQPEPTIDELWQKLNYGSAKKTELFKWLEVDAIPGAEDWADLTEAKMKQAIEFLKGKL